MKRKYHYSLRNGHIMMPRSLISEMINNTASPMSDEMAYVTMLFKTNYADQSLTQDNIIPRGYSRYSLSEWSKTFNWNISRTKRFFDDLQMNGIIDINTQHNPHLLRMTQYELLCAGRKPNEPDNETEKPMSQNERDFEEFWLKYHEITQQTPVDKYAAQREWNRMNIRERRMAMENIEDYFMSLTDIRHVRKALNYLKDKSFLLMDNS